MKIGMFFLLVLIPCATVRGKSMSTRTPDQRTGRYHFSEKGNDNNDGLTEQTPWRTLEKLAEAGRLLPGDSVLLERGSVFSGTLAIYGNGSRTRNIYVGAYGTGEDPVIKGSVALGKWKRFEKNIWVAHCATCHAAPSTLYINGQPHPPGRFPNEGYRDITTSLNSRNSFADKDLTASDQYWNGAEVVVRSSRWTIDRLPVSHYSDNTFFCTQAASDVLEEGFGYFIQKHLSTLDKNGEWFYDATTKEVYVYSEADVAVGGPVIEVNASDTGVRIFDSEFVTVENLAVMNTRQSGVTVTKSNGVTFRRLEIMNAGTNGLTVIGCRNPTVSHSIIRGSSNNGVEWSNNIDGHFTHNTIVRTGLYPGGGASGNGSYIALSITAANPREGNNTILENRIDSTGYSAIDFRTGGTTIRNNVITNFCLVKDDGGGIYTWGNPHGNNSIDGNIILYGRGSAAGTPQRDQLYTSGIYIDDRSAQLSVTGNTVAFCAVAGIFIHNAHSVAIRANKLYHNGNHLPNAEKAQLMIKRDAIVPVSSLPHMSLEVTENILVSIAEGTHCLFLSGEKKGDLTAPGVFRYNQYRSPEPARAIARLAAGDGLCQGLDAMALPEWQADTGLDAGSSFTTIEGAFPARRGENLVKNSTLAEGTTGWFIWPDNAGIHHEKNHHGSSVKAIPPEGKEALLYHPGFALRDGNTYRLSFSVKSAEKAKLEFVPLSATSPWHALGTYACFPSDTAYHTIIWYFKPDQSSTNARLNFKSNTTFWITDVSLHEVTPAWTKKNSTKLIYNETPESRTIPLDKQYVDIDGDAISGRITLGGYTSRILFEME